MKYNVLIGIFIFIGIIAIIMIGNSITGMVTVRQVFGEICTNVTTCSNATQTCCYFYRESSGVCDLEQNCASIYDNTKNESLQSIGFSPFNVPPKENISNPIYYLGLGLIFLLFAIYSIPNLLNDKKNVGLRNDFNNK